MYETLIQWIYEPITTDSFILIKIILYLLVLYFLRLFFYTNYHLPPGPWGIPIIGCLFRIRNRTPHKWYMKMAKKYGSIMSLRLGSHLVVCISDPRLISELFFKPTSVGRPKTPLNQLLEGYGIILSEGELWRKQRLFLFEKFRALGVTLYDNQRFERIIAREIGELLTRLTATAGDRYDPVTLVGRHIHNVICQLMMSFRFEENSLDFVRFNNTVARGMELYGALHIGEHIPLYVRLPGKQATLERIRNYLREVSLFHAQHVLLRQQERLPLGDDNHRNRDLLDYYLEQIDLERDGNMNSIFDGVNKSKQILQVMNDLFSAGMETSRTSLVWALLMMVREPAVARRVRQQLAEVVGRRRLVRLEHRVQLPYVEACLYEVLRRISIVPLGTTHVNEVKWIVNNYTIPKGTHLVPLINSINMNPLHFPEPERFMPERFIVDNAIRLPEAFIAFGVGRRKCIGEKLAIIELFLFFANLMNHFDFHVPEHEEIPGLEGNFSVTHTPKPFNLIFRNLEA